MAQISSLTVVYAYIWSINTTTTKRHTSFANNLVCLIYMVVDRPLNFLKPGPDQSGSYLGPGKNSEVHKGPHINIT